MTPQSPSVMLKECDGHASHTSAECWLDARESGQCLKGQKAAGKSAVCAASVVRRALARDEIAQSELLLLAVAVQWLVYAEPVNHSILGQLASWAALPPLHSTLSIKLHHLCR